MSSSKVITTPVVADKAELPAAVFDPARLAAVAASGLLDSAPEGSFNDLTELALAVTGAGVALFTVVDGRRSFRKAAMGVDTTAGRENDVADSPCHLLIASGRPLIVEDAAADPRIGRLAEVSAWGVGAWAGFPVFSPDGHVLGGLCVVDAHRRPFTEPQLKALRTLARSVSSEVALRQALSESRTAGRASAALARTLQDSLLPPHLPKVAGLDVAAVYMVADATDGEVVGDFYDLFRTRGSSWCAVMGDVCGKGVEAAKITALARYTVRAEATQHEGPVKILQRLHEALVDQAIGDRFLSAVLAVLHPVDAGAFAGRLSSAGHLPALIRRADGTVEEVECPGTILGALIPEVRLREADFRLEPGDAILLYTDGITEARIGRGHPMFGEQGLLAALAATAGMNAGTTVAFLSRAVAAHARGHAFDDSALMLLRVTP
ncbi:PP2C family protein-serine/threonine phosphatase [Embleya sp. MST-111070]|uniref:PP2C family protein-serine/threonine phosphatase n=1 Tax=Embleya sp. MST-111070 TaxID=3398231 RepID=UPI003F7323CE